MKLSIRMKIFLPVMLILIVFPLTSWFAISHSLNGYMNGNARRDLERMIRRLDEIVAGHPVSEAPEGDGETQDGLMADLRNMGRNWTGEAKLLILNEDYRVIYPRDYSDEQTLTQLYAAALYELTASSGWTEGEILEETVEESRYLLYYRYLETGEGPRARHIILYCPVQDTTYILERISRLVLAIMAVMATGAIVVVWFVAGSISGPVRRLCAAARGIGEKRFQHVETGATVRELCELEEEINQMQENLLQADMAERTFFQNASHELRTPLMSISGYAQGIQHGVFSDVSQAAGVILEESSRLTEVVDGILTLTRMDQLRYQVVPAEIGIREFIDERMERLEGLAYSRKIRLLPEPGEEITLISDAMLLERAFSNVVSNCIRYAKSEVRIRVEKEEDRIRVTVSDDGPGLRSEDIDHLFDRFYKGKDGNHGLGLAIAKSSLKYMGGDIEAVSSASGAVFIMRLPQDCRSFAVEEWKEM